MRWKWTGGSARRFGASLKPGRERRSSFSLDRAITTARRSFGYRLSARIAVQESARVTPKYTFVKARFSSLLQEVLHTISAPSGQVQRIVIFKKNGVQAMVEYPLQYKCVFDACDIGRTALRA